MKRAGRPILFCLTVSLLLIAAGCVTNSATKFAYISGGPVSGVAAETSLPLRVAVRPFQDLRGTNKVDHKLLALVPLVPYGTITYDRPEHTGTRPSFTFYPAEDFPRAVVDELRLNGFFREVIYDAGADERDVDLIVSGSVTTTRYVHKDLSYGLSLLTMLPEMRGLVSSAGLPTEIYEYAISFTVEARRASDDIVVWSHVVEGSQWKFVGAYYGGGQYEDFAILLRQGLRSAMESLANEIRTRELSYWKEGL